MELVKFILHKIFIMSIASKINFDKMIIKNKKTQFMLSIN